MVTRCSPGALRVSPDLMLLTVRRLVKDNAELQEEVMQLRAAVNIYRELAQRSHQPKEDSCR